MMNVRVRRKHATSPDGTVAALTLAAMCIITIRCDTSLAQEVRYTPTPSRPAKLPPVWSPDSLMWLRYSCVSKELELTNNQQQQLQQVHDNVIARKFHDYLHGLPRTSPDARRQYIAERGSVLVPGEVQKRINAVLSPNQLTRLTQIRLQMQLRTERADTVLANDEFTNLLDMTVQQKDRLLAIGNDFDMKLRALYNKAEKDLFSILSPDQRALIDSLTLAELPRARTRIRLDIFHSLGELE